MLNTQGHPLLKRVCQFNRIAQNVKCRSGFYDTFTGTATRAARCGSLLERALVSRMLAMDERGGHPDLRGSGRRGVIPYAHGRM
jgi:hypothetical protein